MMENRVLISVVIPVFNGQDVIRKCLDSLMKQTLKDFEILIINDGSKDKTEEICLQYANLFPEKIRYYFQNNSGVSKARNNGIKLAKGKYICFIDSDDYVEPQYLESFFNNCNDVDLVVIGYKIEYFYQDSLSKVIERNPGKCLLQDQKSWNEYFCQLYLDAFFNNPWAKLYRLDLIKNHQISFDENLWYGEDCLFNQTYLSKVKSIKTINQCLYHYISYETETLTSKYDPKKYEVSDRIYLGVKEFINKKQINKNKCLVDKVYLKSMMLLIESMISNNIAIRQILLEINKIKNKPIMKTILKRCTGKNKGYLIYWLIFKIPNNHLIYFFIKIRLWLKKFYIKS